jgi:FAD/FMN-containing dehydrogenase
MDAQVLELVQNVNPSVLSPLPSPTPSSHPYYILIETHGSDEVHDQAKMERFLETVMTPIDSKGDAIIADGVLASSLSQIEEMWKLRESCNPSCAASGYVYKYDISLPIPDFPSFVKDIKQSLDVVEDNKLAIVNWGHVIDGNLHLNVVSVDDFEVDSDFLLPKIESLVLERVKKYGGSISAEHGLGQYKHKYMTKIKDPATLSKMRSIKYLFDPNGILNPGKYLPLEIEELSP